MFTTGDHTSSLSSDYTSEFIHYVVTHVFFPVELPSHNDCSLEKDLLLVRAVCAATHVFGAHVDESFEPRWYHITRMLDKLQVSLQFEHLDNDHIISELRGMKTGDIHTFLIRRQNAAITLTKGENSTLFESFEVSPREDAVDGAPGSLICSYPWSAVEVQNKVFDDRDFQFEFANFISLPDCVDSGLPPPPAAHPQYITALLSGILRSVGHSTAVPSITKRIRDHVGQPQGNGIAPEGAGVWRRSSLWLLVRVAMQMSVDRSPVGRASYKEFMLFFICTFARDAKDKHLSSDLLHLMACKILRRLSKLGSAIPDWLSEMALETCACLREILDARWMQLQSIHSHPPLFHNPSQDELIRDVQPSLLGSREYIRNALANRHLEPLSTPFHPSHHHRGTIYDFLSSNGAKFFQDAYDADSDTTLYDIEQSVEQDIDDWLACVSNIDDACAQLEILMDGYMAKTQIRRIGNPEDSSIVALTALELFVALDKLVVKEIPMLADYSPEIPIAFLEALSLRKATSLHRLACVYQYLSARHSQSHPGWSVLSAEFTKDSFPVRCYDQSTHLQRLKVCIEQDTMGEVTGHASQHKEAICDGYQECQRRRRLDNGGEISELQLPACPLHAKVIVFELQCPACVRIWRSAAPRILHYFSDLVCNHTSPGVQPEENHLLSRIPALQPYFVCHERIPLAVQIHFSCFGAEGSQSGNSSALRYVIQYPSFKEEEYPATGDYSGCIQVPGNFFSVWRRNEHYNDLHFPFKFTSRLYASDTESSSCTALDKYVNYVSHTSNDILAAQADCPVDLSLEEFITFAHLRSGGSLQWANILRGLHSRTLNFRRHHVHYLLSQAAFQVGPLDLNTGVWIWHQELQDSSFCNALLDELDSLFVEAGTGAIDGMMMNSISLLLTRVFVSSPDEGISKRAIALLRCVRRKTFNWIQELSYNLAKAPMNEKRSNLLLDMAAACRSTFDVSPSALCKPFRSPEDVDAALSCAFLLRALRPKPIYGGYLRLFLERDRRLSFALEEILKDSILADTSNYGVDLAVCKIFVYYKPSAHRWEGLQYPNSRWLTCKTKATSGRPSQTVNFNLLDGSLRLDGQVIGGLPLAIREDPQCQIIFQDQGFFIIPSSLPGMDFTTLAITSRYKVHFSLRGSSLVVRAQCNQSNDILELIPPDMLYSDLPPALVFDHIHWLNLSAKIIEIRPSDQLWEQSAENWRIDCASEQYCVYKGRETLVDIRSPTWAMISKCFECFNVKTIDPCSQIRSLLITTSVVDSLQSVTVLQLLVSLPLYGLSFFANAQGELESHDFKDMVYDENKCIGTLFGLDNLVLRQKTYLAEELIPRCVLIPNAAFEKYGDFQVRARINYHLDDRHKSLYQIYNVDAELGCLAGNGTSTSMQLLARLHVMTSHDVPDILTGKTGAQAALDLFQSAGCRSIMERKTSFSIINPWDWSPRYPQIKVAHNRIEHSYYFHQYSAFVAMVDRRAMQRAAYLFPSNATRPTLPEDCKDTDYLTLESDLELESVAFTTASTVHRWSINAVTTNIISDWVAMQGDNMGMGAASSPVPERSTKINLVQTLHDALEKREDTRPHFRLLFLLPMMAYCSPYHQASFLSMLIAFAKHVDSQHLGSPLIYGDCKIMDGYRPTEEFIWRYFRKARLELGERYFKSHQSQERDIVNPVVKQLLKNWPSDALPTTSDLRWLEPRFWDVASLTTSLQQLFSSCHRNFKLKEYLIRVLTEPGSSTLLRPTTSLPHPHLLWQITLEQLLSNRPAPKLPPRCNLLRDSRKVSSDDTSKLNQLLFSISTNKSNSSLQREYIALLEKSAQYVREGCSMTYDLLGEDRINTLEKHYAQCRADYLNAIGIITKTLGPATDRYQQALSRFGQWPPITADVLLRCLASTSQINFPRQWKKCLISLVVLLLDLQRTRRLLRFALDGLEEEFSKELENEGCDGWDPEEYPDWLLIQVQGNFLIRRVQAEMAIEMMSPQCGENTVMQANMGEGKSSVIIPIAAAILADGKQLVRVIVPKALMAQMFELLASRLGRLANRTIYHLPFSRSHSGVDSVRNIMSHCMEKRGILLVPPECVASLKLMSVQEQICTGELATEAVPNFRRSIYKHATAALSLKLISENSFVGSVLRWLSQSSNRSSTRYREHSRNVDDAPDNASKWLSLQKWIHSHARDILDESDEILHARFQLIYTVGLQQHTDGYSDRWTITQQVLRLVKKHVYSLSRYVPDIIECEYRPPGSFPYIHILRASDVSRHLVSLIVEDVMTGRLSNFKFRGVPPSLQDAIRSFISDEDVYQIPDTVKRVEQYASLCSRQLWSGLLLLRGLLSSNVLLFALAERRWRVDYGLVSPTRYSPSWNLTPSLTMLAVPYRAKDMPAPDTHFGHPDIAIILTCLSYYYSGLTEKQLRISFEILLNEDDPSTEYAHWVNDYDDRVLPGSLQTLGEINLKSSEQWDKIVYPLFSRNQATIDFYLSRKVFPQEMKEYPWKLCASSWDLAEKRERPITGFSGTNDGRWLLPMSIAQRDLDHQQGASSRVLTYLLQPENNYYAVTRDESCQRPTTNRFLRMVAIQQPEIRVLLDVGAQILDFSNYQVAKAWLDIARDVVGAVYFNEDDELVVLMRHGISVPLLSSSLSRQLHRCVVYLDHAHTRGTDIKLPMGSRAAVTLGPKVTKDRLVQGCMRMRKLEHGHSVMFFAPPEVDRSIRAVAAKNDPNTRVTTVDILSWAINETLTDIRQRAPYWAQQGMSHKSRHDAWTNFASRKLTREKLADAWLQPELKSLADLYAPSESISSSRSLSRLDPEIRQRCKNLGVLSLPEAQMTEEQEREVNLEREREREVELPPKAQSAGHSLHPDVVEFVNTGNIPPLNATTAFRPVFTTLEKSSATTHEVSVWSSSILATTDFCNTIKPESTKGTIDQYLRPVQWILSRKNDGDPLFVLVSPFEADHLMPDIRASEYVHLHLYEPRTSQRMKPSDNLSLYSIPPLPSSWTPPWALIDQLDLFAGQLYLRDYNSYLRLCHFLGVPTKEFPNDDPSVRWNLFKIPGGIEENENRFSDSPLPFVMALLSIRSRGRPFTGTHMGQILQGNILTAIAFEGPRKVVSGPSHARQAPHDTMSKISPPSPVDMERDTSNGPGLV